MHPRPLALSLLALTLAAPSLRAEEGMWTFDNPPTKQIQEKYGWAPDQAWLDHVRLSSLRFPGGSGSFVSRDGLVPKLFSDLHPKFQTPYKSNWIFLVLVGGFAAFVPGDIVGDMTSIGTLFAFILVCAGVWILRITNPEIPRQFKVPLVPLVSVLGIGVCAAMIAGLGKLNWERLGVWLVIGLVIYFGYSRKRSKLNNE